MDRSLSIHLSFSNSPSPVSPLSSRLFSILAPGSPSVLLGCGLSLFLLLAGAETTRAGTPATGAESRHAGPAIATGVVPHPPIEDTLTVGLALSGGGAKGFAHIGVLQELRRIGVPIDVIAGTSMGSVVGGLYASGYSADQLAGLARSRDWEVLFRDGAPRRLQSIDRRINSDPYLLRAPLDGGRVNLPTGLIEGQRISQFLTRSLSHVHHVEDFRSLPVPFASVATDLATGKGVRFVEGYLPEAIRASIGIPTLFAPVTINGRRYIDGGVARNLPAEDARALGADILICSSVSDPTVPVDSLRSLVDIAFQTVGFRMAESSARQEELCDVTIRPDVRRFDVLDFRRPSPLIREGRSAVNRRRDDLLQIVSNLSPPPTAPAANPDSSSTGPGNAGAGNADAANAGAAEPNTADPNAAEASAARSSAAEPDATEPDSLAPSEPVRDSTGARSAPEKGASVFYLTGLSVDGPAGASAVDRVRGLLALDLPVPASLDDIEEAVGRVYGSGLFRQVTYRLLPAEPASGDARPDSLTSADPSRMADSVSTASDPPPRRLLVQVHPRETGQVGVGLRYDTPYQAAVIIGARIRPEPTEPGVIEGHVRLGEVRELRLQYDRTLAYGPPSGWQSTLAVRQFPIDLYADGERGARLGVQQVAGAVRLGTVRRDVLAGIQLRGEAAVYRDDIGDPAPFLKRPTGRLRGMMQAEAFLLHDSMNEAAFPTRGMRLRASVTGARDGWLSNESFARTLLRVRGRIPVPFVRPLTLIAGGTTGRTFGTPPLHHRFFLGGVFPHRILEGRQFPFWGQDVQERAGTNLWEVMGGLQIGLPLDFTATVRWNAVRLTETWAWLPEPASFAAGGGVGIGRETIVGPVEVVVGSRGLDGPYSVRLQLGTQF